MDKSFLLNFLPVDSHILEAGAHIGTDTVQLAEQFHAGQIYSFEPVTAVFSQLRQNVGNRPNVHLFNLALDNVTSTKEMYISSGGSDCSSSLLPPKEHLTLHPDIFYEHRETVRTITIDDWATQNNIQKIDFIWFDLEGNEFNVLSKAGKILPGVKMIYTEISYVERFSGSCLYQEYRNFLISQGFTEMFHEVCIEGNFGDSLFFRKAV